MKLIQGGPAQRPVFSQMNHSPPSTLLQLRHRKAATRTHLQAVNQVTPVLKMFCRWRHDTGLVKVTLTTLRLVSQGVQSVNSHTLSSVFLCVGCLIFVFKFPLQFVFLLLPFSLFLFPFVPSSILASSLQLQSMRSLHMHASTTIKAPMSAATRPLANMTDSTTRC